MSNLNPLSVVVPADLLNGFDAVSGDVERLALSTASLLGLLAGHGIELAYFNAPGKDAAPEHNHGYAVLRRVGIEKLRAKHGGTLEEFEPVFADGVEHKTPVTIGDKTLTRHGWQKEITNQLRPVRKALEDRARADLATAKDALARVQVEHVKAVAQAGATERATLDAEEAAEIANGAVKDAKAAFDAAKGKAKVAAKAALGQAEDAAKAAQAKLAEIEAFDAEALAWAKDCEAAIEDAKDAVLLMEAKLPAKRGASVTATEAEKLKARLDKLLSDLRECGGIDGIEIDDVILHLAKARAACGK